MIFFEIPVRTPNGSGGFRTDWAAPAGVWAEMVPLRSQTALEHLLERSRQTWKVSIDWRPDITGECRAVFEGKALEIVGEPIDPDGRRRELVMTCVSGQAA